MHSPNCEFAIDPPDALSAGTRTTQLAIKDKGRRASRSKGKKYLLHGRVVPGGVAQAPKGSEATAVQDSGRAEQRRERANCAGASMGNVNVVRDTVLYPKHGTSSD
jgi:hypothetical protein